jgi:hypothetical protein
VSDVVVPYVNAQDISATKIHHSDCLAEQVDRVSRALKPAIPENLLGDNNMPPVPVHDKESGRVLGYVRPDHKNAGRVVIDNESVGAHRLKEKMEINSAEGAEKEKSEQELREERKRKRERAENHANDVLLEARENLADFKSVYHKVLYGLMPLAIGAALSPIVFFGTAWMLVPMILGTIAFLAGAGTLINWHVDRTHYNLEKDVRDAANKHRDVTNRAESWYDKKAEDEL